MERNPQKNHDSNHENSSPKNVIEHTQPEPKKEGKIYKKLDNFCLIKKLGYGMTANVYLGKEQRTGKKYAIKIAKKDENFQQNWDSLRNEHQKLNECNNDNIIRTREFRENGV